MVRFAPFLLILALEIFCLIDVITSPSDRVRYMPKPVWGLLVLFFPLVGSIAWLIAGRPLAAPAGRSPYERPATAYPEYDRPGRAAGLSPESDEEFLRKVRERAEEQRRAYREQQLERERRERGEGSGPGEDPATGP